MRSVYKLLTNWKILLILSVFIPIYDNRTISTDYIENQEQETNGYSFIDDSYFTRFIRRRHIPHIIKRNRCELKLVADYEFFRVIGNNNYANAARYLVGYFIFILIFR